MLEVNISGFGKLRLTHLVLDYNGTLALDGTLLEGLHPILNELAKQMKIHVLTGDTFGTAKTELAGINCKLTIMPSENQAETKQIYLKQLHSKEVVAIGNGRNDEYMLKMASVGIAILGGEGAAIESVIAADIVSPDIYTALNLLKHPQRLVATLRS